MGVGSLGGLALKSGCKEEDSDAGKSGSLNGDQRVSEFHNICVLTD